MAYVQTITAPYMNKSNETVEASNIVEAQQ